MMIIPRVARIALCMRQFSTASKAASKLTESARKPEARSMATAADSKMEFQRSTYYVGDTPGWTNEWYKENDSPRCLFARALRSGALRCARSMSTHTDGFLVCSAILDKFQVAIASNRASAASSWKSAVRLMRASSSQCRDSYCYR